MLFHPGDAGFQPPFEGDSPGLLGFLRGEVQHPVHDVPGGELACIADAEARVSADQKEILHHDLLRGVRFYAGKEDEFFLGEIGFLRLVATGHQNLLPALGQAD